MDGWVRDVEGLDNENFVNRGFLSMVVVLQRRLVSGGFVLNVCYLVPPCLWSLLLYPSCIITMAEPHFLSKLVRISSQRIGQINLVQTSSHLRYVSFIIVASSIKH